MKKFKQTIILSLFLAITLFGNSCSNEVYENTIENSSELKIRKVTFEDFKNNTTAYSRYAELEEKKQQPYAGRLIEDTINNFVINTEEASYIEKGAYNSYAFEIYRSDSHDKKVENILFSLNSEGNYDTYLVKYDFTEEELKTMSQQEIYSRATKYTLLDDSSAERVHMEIFCIEIWEEVCDLPIDHGDNTGGPIEYDCRWVLHSADCETSGGSAGGGGGGGISIDPGTSPGNNSPATGSGSGNTSLPIITTPTTCGRCPDFNEELFDTVTNLSNALNLTAAERQWLYDHQRIAEKLEDFLNENNDIALELGQDMIQHGMNENLSINNMISLVNNITDPCIAKIIFNSFLKVNSSFTNLMKSTFAQSEDVNLGISNVEGNDVDGGGSAGTAWEQVDVLDDSGNVIDTAFSIEIDNDVLAQSTDLGIVVLVYHELLHAYMLQSYQAGNLLTEFPQYTNLKISLDNLYANPSESNKNLANIQMHNIYVDFIGIIGQAVYDYCQEYNIAGINQAYAQSLVWGSLQGYDVFTNNLNQTQQDQAITNISNERYNQPNAKSNKTCP